MLMSLATEIRRHIRRQMHVAYKRLTTLTLHLGITFYLILPSVPLGYDTVSTDFGNECQHFVPFSAPIIIQKLKLRRKSFITKNVTLE